MSYGVTHRKREEDDESWKWNEGWRIQFISFSDDDDDNNNGWSPWWLILTITSDTFDTLHLRYLIFLYLIYYHLRASLSASVLFLPAVIWLCVLSGLSGLSDPVSFSFSFSFSLPCLFCSHALPYPCSCNQQIISVLRPAALVTLFLWCLRYPTLVRHLYVFCFLFSSPFCSLLSHLSLGEFV